MLGIRRQGKVRGAWCVVRGQSQRRSGSDCDWYRCRAIGAGMDRASGVGCRLARANKSKIHQPSAISWTTQPAHMFHCVEPGRSCNLMPQWEKCWASEWPKLRMLFPKRWLARFCWAVCILWNFVLIIYVYILFIETFNIIC